MSEPSRPVAPPPSAELTVYVANQSREIEALLALAGRFQETGSESDADALRERADRVVGWWAASDCWTAADIDDSRRFRSFVLAIREIVSRLTEALADGVGLTAADFARAATAPMMMIRYENVLELVPDPLAASHGVLAPVVQVPRLDPEPKPVAIEDHVQAVAAEAPAAGFAAWATALRKDRKPTQALLVEYMATRSEATVDDVAREVHDDPEASDKTVAQNARRTSDSLAELGSPYRFRAVAGRVFRETIREVAEK